MHGSKERKSAIDHRNDAHLLGLSALQTLNTATDLVVKEDAMRVLRESIEKETSLISYEEIDKGDFDFDLIEWKWRLLEELSYESSAAWFETATTLWRWSLISSCDVLCLML